MAATLAIGSESAVSHRSGAGHWGFRFMAPGARVDVIVPRGRADRRGGIALHRTRHLPAEDVTVLDGIPVTTVARTLVDLAAVLGSEQLRRSFEEAERLSLLARGELELVLTRSNGRRGVGRLRALIEAQRAPTPRTRSNAELRFFRLCESAGLAMPEVNARVAGFEVDFLWRRERLIVELDGSSFHDRPGQGERDRRKDVSLSLAGYEVHRFGTDRVYAEPTVLLGEVRMLLERRWQGFRTASG